MTSLQSRKLFKLLIFALFSSQTWGTHQEEEWRPEKLGNVLESTLVRYYVFNLNNPEEFESGEVPEFKEIGPFTYREKRVKKNLRREGDNKLKYDIEWSMHFLPELTRKGLSETTELTGVNLPYVILAEGLSTMGLPKSFNDILIDELAEAGETFYKKGINFGDSIFYGYNISLYSEILDDITQGQTAERYPELANGKFAFYKDKNGTVTANYTVLSTKSTPFGKIMEYKGSSSMGFWQPESKCDDVSGTFDFFTFPRNVKKDEEYRIFLPENCRSLKLRFVQEDVFRGIPVYTFHFPLEQFHTDLGDKNDCYCLNYANISDPQCLGEGLIDYAGCSKGAPLVGSFPHFLNANQRHLKNVRGLMPNKSLHESEVMIEPITGTPLYAVRRFQVNLKMHPILSVTRFQNVTERIMPLAWFEHILEVPSSLFTEVKEKLEKLKNGEKILTDKEKYENEPHPLGEMNDNNLFAQRNGFPSSTSMEKVRERHVPGDNFAICKSPSFLYLAGAVCIAQFYMKMVGV